MSQKYRKLFEPASIGKLQLKNKMAMAPMGPLGYADSNYAFNQRLQDYYVERAKGGIGLIITGLCIVDPQEEGVTQPVLPCPNVNPPAFITNANQMNERIHAYGTKIFLQLTGGFGRSAMPMMPKKFIAPSEQENRFDPRITHREMTKEEIQNTVKNFAMAAKVAQMSGFDGVEIHAVHEGYLLDQFAISFYNHRTDEYGGSLENRLRFAIEIVKAIKKVCGEDFPVSLRYSLKSCIKGLRQGGLPGEDYKEAGRDIEEGVQAAKILVHAGYDALNVDAGTYDSWYWNHPPMYFEKEGIYCEYGEILKKEVDVPIILAGRMENPDLAVKELGKSCDIVEYGRQLLSDPYYPEKVRTDRLDEVRPCLGCHEGCLGRGSKAPISCAVNPECGREEIYKITKGKTPKNVLIVGGGVAGCEAARVCAERGHRVVLCEKSSQLGGNLIPGGVPEFKRYDRMLVSWYKRQLELLGVDVRLNTEINQETAEQSEADVIVIATGSTPIHLNQEELKAAVPADEVLLGKTEAGQNIAIIGGGLVGCETALWLAEQGKKPYVIEMTDEIVGGPHALPFMNYSMLTELLQFYKIPVYKNAQAKKINGDSILITTPDGEKSFCADTVISAVGYRSENQLYESLKMIDKPIYNIGDSKQVHNIMYAIWDAYEVAKNI